MLIDLYNPLSYVLSPKKPMWAFKYNFCDIKTMYFNSKFNFSRQNLVQLSKSMIKFD